MGGRGLGGESGNILIASDGFRAHDGGRARELTTMWSRLSVVAVIAGLVVAAGEVPVLASYEGRSGRIAYSEYSESVDGWPQEIYTMNPDGSDRRRVTFDGGVFVKSTVSEEGDVYDVYTSNFDPTWSPDGSTLAYLHYGVRDRYEVRAVDPDGRNMRVLFSDWRAEMFTWSPDGKRIAYADGRGVWVAGADGSAARLIAAPTRGQWPNGPDMASRSFGVQWSPDGSRLAFIEDSGGGLVAGWQYASTVDVDGSNRRTEVCGGFGYDYPVGTIAWAPNSDWLACGSWSGSWDAHIRTAMWNGAVVNERMRGVSPLWSPDGTEMRFLRYGTSVEVADLWSYDVSSAVEERLSTNFGGFDLDWQPLQGTFWDDERSVFNADIEWMAEVGITKGCNPPLNDRFCPYSVVTRGQMAAFLARALSLTERLDNPFTDDDDSIFEADIERLAAAGITKGCNPSEGNTKFCPDDKVTRGQMAAFLVRALGYTDNGGGDLFTDDNDSIFEAEIDRLGTAGVTKGCNPPTNDRYCPTGNVTRGQMAAFLHRALG
jgi:Tol biopolymer transport system component